MTSPNTPVDVEALEAVARTATPGPWFVDGKRRSGAGAYTIWGPDGIGGGTIGSCDDATLAYRADNAAFIATFDPPTVLRLLAERREMLEALKVIAAFKRERPTGNPGSYQRGYDIGFNNAGLCAAGIAQAVVVKIEGRSASSEGKGE